MGGFTYARTGRNRWGSYREAWVDSDSVITADDGECYANEDTANECGVYQCADSGEWYDEDYLVTCTAGRHEDEQIHQDRAVTDYLTGEVVHCNEAIETADGWVFRQNDATEFFTGESHHREAMLAIRIPGRTIYIRPTTWEDTDPINSLLICGSTSSTRLLLLPPGYYGTSVCQFQPWPGMTFDNVVEGDEAGEISHLLCAIREYALPSPQLELLAA